MNEQVVSRDQLRDEIHAVHLALFNTLHEYRDAKLRELRAQHAWDAWYLQAVAQGEIAGKNSEERLGHAILAQPDLWLELQQAREGALRHDLHVKIARVDDKRVGRLLMLETHVTEFEGAATDDD